MRSDPSRGRLQGRIGRGEAYGGGEMPMKDEGSGVGGGREGPSLRHKPSKGDG